MTHEQFKEKYIGVPVDYDKAYGAQCVDVARQYICDVHKVNQPEGVNGAADFFINHDKRPNQQKNYYCIKYQEGLEAPQGALIIWAPNKDNGNYGHIAVCDNSTQNNITVFEQDGFDNPTKDVKLGSANGMKERVRSYNNVLGWLVLKQNKINVSVIGNVPPAGATIVQSDRNGNYGDYWFNTSTNRWMILRGNPTRWENI